MIAVNTDLGDVKARKVRYSQMTGRMTVPRTLPPKEKGYTIDEMIEMDMMPDDDW